MAEYQHQPPLDSIETNLLALVASTSALCSSVAETKLLLQEILNLLPPLTNQEQSHEEPEGLLDSTEIHKLRAIVEAKVFDEMLERVNTVLPKIEPLRDASFVSNKVLAESSDDVSGMASSDLSSLILEDKDDLEGTAVVYKVFDEMLKTTSDETWMFGDNDETEFINNEASKLRPSGGKSQSSSTFSPGDVSLTIGLVGPLQLLSSTVTMLAVPTPSLTAILARGGNYPAVVVPLVSMGTQRGTIDIVDVSATAIAASLAVRHGTVRGLRWLGNSRLVSFSYTQASETTGGYVNKLVITCFDPGGRLQLQLRGRYSCIYIIMNGVAVVVYKLELPDSLRIPPMFYVSLLQSCVEHHEQQDPWRAKFMLLSMLVALLVASNCVASIIDERMSFDPGISKHMVEFIHNRTELEKRAVHRAPYLIEQWLIPWEGLPISEATWDANKHILQTFPTFSLEDKVVLMGTVML